MVVEVSREDGTRYLCFSPSATVQGSFHWLFIVLFPKGYTRTLSNGDVPHHAPCPQGPAGGNRL